MNNLCPGCCGNVDKAVENWHRTVMKYFTKIGFFRKQDKATFDGALSGIRCSSQRAAVQLDFSCFSSSSFDAQRKSGAASCRRDAKQAFNHKYSAEHKPGFRCFPGNPGLITPSHKTRRGRKLYIPGLKIEMTGLWRLSFSFRPRLICSA